MKKEANNFIILFIDSLSSGGAQRQIIELAILLSKNNFQVKIVFYHNIIFYKEYLNDNNISYELINNSSNKLLRIFETYKYFKNTKPDNVFSFLDIPNQIMVVLRILGLKFKLVVSERNTTQKLSIKEKIKFYLYRYSDVIVVNSFSQTKFICNNFDKLCKKTLTIVNNIDIDHFYYKQFRSNSNLKTISIVGRYEPQKNTINMIYAIDHLIKERKDFRIYWYGNNFFINNQPTKNSTYYLEAKRLIKQLNISKYIVLLPSRKDIRSIYHNSDILCSPSLFEGFSNVISEAMACGKPILCSNVSDNSLFVKEKENGFLFDPHKPNQIKDAFIKILATDSAKLIYMGIKSRERIEELMIKNKYQKKYKDLLDSIQIST